MKERVGRGQKIRRWCGIWWRRGWEKDKNEQKAGEQMKENISRLQKLRRRWGKWGWTRDEMTQEIGRLRHKAGERGSRGCAEEKKTGERGRVEGMYFAIAMILWERIWELDKHKL
jgi:hypothetical protein